MSEDEVKALTKELRGQGIDVEVYTGGEGTSSYQLTEVSAETLARVALEWVEEQGEPLAMRLVDPAMEKPYDEEE